MNRNEPARASNLERARQYGLSGGDQVALEVDWTGTLAVVFESIPAGEEARRVSAVPGPQAHRAAQL